MPVFQLPGVGRVVSQRPLPLIPVLQYQYQCLFVVFQPLHVVLQEAVRFQFRCFHISWWLSLVFQPRDVVLQPPGSQLLFFQHWRLTPVFQPSGCCVAAPGVSISLLSTVTPSGWFLCFSRWMGS
jgi:hypothetical protein